MMVFMCLDNRCPPVPTIALATPNTTLSENDTVVSYTCQYGYLFYKGDFTLRCLDGSWIGTIQQCQRKIKLKRFIYNGLFIKPNVCVGTGLNDDIFIVLKREGYTINLH